MGFAFFTEKVSVTDLICLTVNKTSGDNNLDDFPAKCRFRHLLFSCGLPFTSYILEKMLKLDETLKRLV